MNLNFPLTRLFKQPPSYIFGRFLLVRRMYSLLRRLIPSSDFDRGSILNETIFKKLEVINVVQELRITAVAFGFDLPDDIVSEIREFASTCELKACNVPYKFYYKDVDKGVLSDGTVVAIGYSVDPQQCKAIQKVLHDPFLNMAVKDYLGYQPNNYEVRLYYSFATDLTDGERRNRNQTIDYHFDVHGFNFCYAHFYITDTDKYSGAHVLVKSSHKDKPFKYLLGSARKSDIEISEYYDESKILVIEGKAGTGFLEDTSCFHKALAPISQDRLLLQIRFF